VGTLHATYVSPLRSLIHSWPVETSPISASDHKFKGDESDNGSNDDARLNVSFREDLRARDLFSLEDLTSYISR
jgi:hypothetical protein